jgi:hypothetical protein
MDEIEPDLLIYCVALAGEDSANVCAHVCRAWRDAARAVWGRWRSGAWAVTSSVERYRWAESIGCPWRGRTLMRAAARVGAVDLLSVVAPLYREWDDGATYEAAVADHVEIIRRLATRPDPALVYGAGPLVRAHLEALDPMYRFLDPSRDFRTLLRGAVAIEPPVPTGGWTSETIERLGASLGWPLGASLGPHPPAVTLRSSVKLAASQWGATGVRVRLPHKWWSIVYDLQPSVGRIRYIEIGGQTYDFDHRRKWFLAGAKFHQWSIIIQVGDRVVPTVDLAYAAALVPEQQWETTLWQDDWFCYRSGIGMSRCYWIQQSLDVGLTRVDGGAADAPLLADASLAPIVALLGFSW